MLNAFPDGLDLFDVSPVTYIDTIMNGEFNAEICDHS